MKAKMFFVLFCMTILGTGCEVAKESRNSSGDATQATAKRLAIQIILGSTRHGRTSDKIATVLKQFADKRNDITTELIDLRDYNLPFLSDEAIPARREKITDPILQRWADKVLQADAFIIVFPEYNAGYPGVLKNALDSLYKEWHNKPVGLVAYSGGSTGGTSALAQLRKVLSTGLEMNPVAAEIKIPQVWKAFDESGNLTNKNIENEFNTMINQLIRAKS